MSTASAALRFYRAHIVLVLGFVFVCNSVLILSRRRIFTIPGAEVDLGAHKHESGDSEIQQYGGEEENRLWEVRYRCGI